MTQRSLSMVFGLGCLALMCLADGSPARAQRGGGRGQSAPSAGRSGGSSSHSAPSGGSGSSSSFQRPSASPSGGSRGSPPPPRSAPSAPRYTPPPAPRTTPPPEAPRYQPPPPTRSRPVEPPRESPRYIPPDNAGRVEDGGRRFGDGRADLPVSRGPASARSGSGATPESAAFDRANTRDGGPPAHEGDGTDPRSNERGWNGLAFERVPPRTPIPVLSVPSRGPGASRTGLVPGSGRHLSERAVAEGEGLVRIPHAPVTRESILERYHSASPANPATLDEHRESSANDLSRARRALVRDTDLRAPSERPAVHTDVPARGSLEAARREREASDHLDRLRAAHPERARAFDDAGRAVAHAANAAAHLSIGASLAFGTGSFGGWFWQPTCNPGFNHGSWFWNGCSGWPIWCSPHCGFGWPFGWGFSWWGNGWNVSWNSCWSSPWSTCSYSPYWSYPSSYIDWSPTPEYYTTIVYAGSDGGDEAYVPRNSAVYQQPDEEAAGAGAVLAQPNGAQAQGSALGRGVSQYLSLGDDAFSQGRYSDAVHDYASAVEAAPDDGVLYLILSDALFATGDYHYAAFALRRALELDGNLLDSIVDKHGFYGDPNDFDKQISVAESYLDEHFLDDDARLVLAANYLFANRPAQSADLLLSAFSKSVRESSSGALLLQRAEDLRKQHPLSK